MPLPEKFVLFDTEFTSWEGAMARGWSGPGEHREVIQIGAIRVDGLQEADSFCVYVKPVKNPALSDFIKELTGISQETVDQEGKSLGEALNGFKDFAEDLPAYCYGSDEEVLRQNCELLKLPFPMETTRFVDIRQLITPYLESRGIPVGQYSSGTLLQAFGKKTTHRAHDAVNDMRNLLEALNALFNTPDGESA